MTHEYYVIVFFWLHHAWSLFDLTLDTYAGMSWNLAREALKATFKMSSIESKLV
jgi:hypothetical protein